MERYIQIDDLFIGKYRKYVFDDISDISSCSAKSQIDTFTGGDGAAYSNTTYEPRAFEIKGTILAVDLEELKSLKLKLIKACNPKIQKMIYYFDGFEKYRAMAYFDGGITFGNRKKTSMSFIIYIVLPSFYWEKAKTTVLSVCKRKDEISTSFTLPCVFTSKDTQAEIVNDTDMDILPVIKIKINSASGMNSITVLNETSDSSITISGYAFAAGEEVTIDCENVKAYSNITSNLLNFCNDFEDWSIIPGKNVIKGLNNDTLIDADIAVMYNEKRIGV